MKKCYLDSNFLVYLKNETSPFYPRAVSTLRELIAIDIEIYISPLVLDEFLHSFSKELRSASVKNIFSNLNRALNGVLNIPMLKLINPPLEISVQMRILDLMERYNLHSRDAYHLLTMLSNNIDSFATFDTDFRIVFSAGLIKKV